MASPDSGVTETTQSLLSLYRVSPEEQKEKRLLLFMGTRLGIATLLLGVALKFALDAEVGFDSFTPRFLVGLIITIYSTSLVFALWLLRTDHKNRVALAQVAWDLALTTALVYVTGGPSSGFTFLYGVAVLTAAMVVGPVPARITGLVSLFLFVGLGYCLTVGWISPPPDQSIEAYLLPLSELSSTGLFNVFGLLLVTMLASGLASRLRLAGGQLKRAEAGAEQLARINDDIVRSLGSGLLTSDANMRIRTVNPTAAEIFGVAAEDLIGKPVEEVLPTALPDDQRIFRAEGTANRPTGSQFPVGYSITPLVDVEGQGVGNVLVFQDLTEISELRDAAKRSERLAILGRLSAGLAHEIRNPLNSISGSVELVRESPRLDDQERRLLSVVLAETDRLNELVTTMLQVGRPVSPQRTDENIVQLVEEVAEMARRGPAAATDVTIETRLPDEPLLAWIDGGQVRQVLWNLIKNALQASPHEATLRVAVEPKDGGGVVIEVTDEGAGFEPQQKERLFDMFYSERTHGAGIGLALVRQIVDAHGGKIEVDSAPHRGATFRVTLPPKSD